MTTCETCHRPMSALGCGFDGHTQTRKLAITPTIDNVLDLLHKIGCEGKILSKGEYMRGWQRVYIVAKGVQIGRVMFMDDVFQWVRWYRKPDGDIDPNDRYWVAWHLLLGTGKPLEDEDWELLKALAALRASEQFRGRTTRRLYLNLNRVSLGKRRRTRKICPGNPARAAVRIVEESIYEAGGRYHDL